MIRALVQIETDLYAKIGHFCPISHIVLKHGIERRGSPLPPGIRKMRVKECFKNAFEISLDHNLTYCEGLAVRTGLDIPIHHAWCVDDDKRVIDPTWRDAEECSYLGVEIEPFALLKVVARKRVYGFFTEQVGYDFEAMEMLSPGFTQFAIAERARLIEAAPRFLKERVAL